MQGNNLKDQDASKLNRRKFLTRTGAGFVIASLPAKSVWASSNGLAGSIMASGHASDFAGGNDLVFQKAEFFRQFEHELKKVTFSHYFGGNIFNSEGRVSNSTNITLWQIIQDKSRHKGKDDINLTLVTLLLNAVFNNKHGIFYPVIGTSSFKTDKNFASHIYNLAVKDVHNTARVLKHFLANPNH